MVIEGKWHNVLEIWEIIVWLQIQVMELDTPSRLKAHDRSLISYQIKYLQNIYIDY